MFLIGSRAPCRSRGVINSFRFNLKESILRAIISEYICVIKEIDLRAYTIFRVYYFSPLSSPANNIH